MRSWWSRMHDQRGQVLVIVAGGFIGLAAIAALVLEGGTVILNRRDAQNASDLAAVAGTRIVALNYTSGTTRTRAAVYDAVDASLRLNDCAPGAGVPCAWEAEFVGAGLAPLGTVTNSATGLPSGTLGVKVAVTRQPGAILGRVLGFDTWTVSTEGTALTAKPSGFPGGIMLPVALCGWIDYVDPDHCGQAASTPAPGNFIDFQPGQIYDLTDGKDAPGGFGWLSWTGANDANTLEASVCTANNPPFSLDSPYDNPGAPGSIPGQSSTPGDGEVWFPEGPGKMDSSGMRTCLDKWIDSGATVLVPIYDLVVKAPPLKPTYHITGVAAFVLVAREQPAVDQIQGYFVEYYPYTDIPGGIGSQPPGPGDTTYFLGLVR